MLNFICFMILADIISVLFFVILMIKNRGDEAGTCLALLIMLSLITAVCMGMY